MQNVNELERALANLEAFAFSNSDQVKPEPSEYYATPGSKIFKAWTYLAEGLVEIKGADDQDLASPKPKIIRGSSRRPGTGTK